MIRNKIIKSICFITVVCSFQTFAAGTDEYSGGNVLWYKAADIVDASESVLPVEKTVVWEELSPGGEVINQKELVVFYGEEKGYTFNSVSGKLISGKELSIHFAGDTDVITKRAAVNDGLFRTPFDDDVEDADVKVKNTGCVETVSGTECSVFEYTMYRDAAGFDYCFEESILDGNLFEDYKEPESSSFVKIKGLAWIDGKGVMRQLESNINMNGVNCRETVKYNYDGTALYPVESVLEGTINNTDGDLIIKTNFKATETMSGYWVATDFCR